VEHCSTIVAAIVLSLWTYLWIFAVSVGRSLRVIYNSWVTWCLARRRCLRRLLRSKFTAYGLFIASLYIKSLGHLACAFSAFILKVHIMWCVHCQLLYYRFTLYGVYVTGNVLLVQLTIKAVCTVFLLVFKSCIIASVLTVFFNFKYTERLILSRLRVCFFTFCLWICKGFVYVNLHLCRTPIYAELQFMADADLLEAFLVYVCFYRLGLLQSWWWRKYFYLHQRAMNLLGKFRVMISFVSNVYI